MTAPRDMSMMHAALGWHQGTGRPVIPLRPGTSREPAIRGWGSSGGLRSIGSIVHHWERHPDHMPATPTGRVRGHVPLWVLDVDHADVLDAWLAERGLTAEPTLRISSGRPGRHQDWYRGRDEESWSRALPALGADAKADGGLVLVPGARHWSGSTYRVVHGSPDALSDAAPWFVAEATRPPVGTSSSTSPRPASRRAPVAAWEPPMMDVEVPEHLQANLATTLPRGRRSEPMWAATLGLLRAGLSEPQVVSVVWHSPLGGDRARERGAGFLADEVARAAEQVRQQHPASTVAGAAEHGQRVAMQVRASAHRLGLPAGQVRALRAHVTQCEEQGYGRYRAAEREVAEGAAMDRRSARDATAALVERGLLTEEAAAPGAAARCYRLVLTDEAAAAALQVAAGGAARRGGHVVGTGGILRQSEMPPYETGLEWPIEEHDAMRDDAIGSSVSVLLALAETDVSDTATLVAATAASRPTTMRHLARMVEHGLVERPTRGRYRLVTDWAERLDGVAEVCGTDGRLAQQQTRHDHDRKLLREHRDEVADEDRRQREVMSRLDADLCHAGLDREARARARLLSTRLIDRGVPYDDILLWALRREEALT